MKKWCITCIDVWEECRYQPGLPKFIEPTYLLEYSTGDIQNDSLKDAVKEVCEKIGLSYDDNCVMDFGDGLIKLSFETDENGVKIDGDGLVARKIGCNIYMEEYQEEYSCTMTPDIDDVMDAMGFAMYKPV